VSRFPIPEINGYGEELVTALGALVIRASQHEAWLISLTAAIADMRRGQAWAIFYASANAKARLDTMRALLGVSGLSARRQRELTAFLDRSKDLADRRNVYVHSEYSIARYPSPSSPPRPLMTQYQSATGKQLKVRPIELAHLHKLLNDYTLLNDDIRHYAPDLQAARERRRRRIAVVLRGRQATAATE